VGVVVERYRCGPQPVGGGWLLFGFRADNPRYNHPPTFDVDPGNVRRLIHDQAKVGALVVAGSALQLLGVVLERIS
jgi:hypothetical protein